MIQRRQNLYLALVVILSLILSFSSYGVAEFELTENATESAQLGKHIRMNYSSNVFYSKSDNVILTKISTAKVQYILWCIALLALISIASFKNLKRQSTYCAFNFAFILFLPVFVFLDYSVLSDLYEVKTFSLLGTALIPIALLLLNYLATRGVVKDHNLLKSMDRIR